MIGLMVLEGLSGEFCSGPVVRTLHFLCCPWGKKCGDQTLLGDKVDPFLGLIQLLTSRAGAYRTPIMLCSTYLLTYWSSQLGCTKKLYLTLVVCCAQDCKTFSSFSFLTNGFQSVVKNEIPTNPPCCEVIS